MKPRKIPTGGGPVLAIPLAPGAVTDDADHACCGECGMDAPDHYEDCEERTLPPGATDPVGRLRTIMEAAERARKARRRAPGR